MRTTHQFYHPLSSPSCVVPLAALFKCDPFPTKDIKSTADSEINFAIAQLLHQLKILDASSTTRISNWDPTDLGQVAHKFLVNPCLQTFGICCMDEKLAAVWFQ
jgi:hypothetical protein